MALRTPAPQKDPYDQRGNQDSLPPSDEGLRHLTGINSDEEKAMDARAKEALADREEAGDDFKYKRGQGRGKSSAATQNPGFYKSLKDGLSNRRKKRLLMTASGVLGAAFIAIVIALFGFLNVFKLDSLMSNIDAHAFARINGSMDNRSTSWIIAYMQLRLADIGDNPDLNKPNDPDNLLFRSNQVQTGSPVRDWYRTLRTSKFEQDVFEKNGIKFTSVAYRNGNKISFRTATITYKDQPVHFNLTGDEIAAIEKGDTSKFNGRLRQFVEVNEFGNDKEARSAIKAFVKDNTRWNQVFKRRMVRKSIQNMTGVRDWRFFENTRNKIDDKKIDIRNKILTKAFPESTKSGKFIQCLFGISNCVYNSDPAAPSNSVNEDLVGNENLAQGSEQEITGSDGKPVAATVDLEPAASAVKDVTSQILEKANLALSSLNIVSTLDAFSRVNDAIANHDISKGIAVARGVQAMGLYQVFETSRDQIKTGQVQSAEVNAFMNTIGTVAGSEAMTKVINGNGDASKITNTPKSKAYCDPKHQEALAKNVTQANKEFAYLCPSQQIGGSSKAADLENAYDNGIGSVIKPVVKAYEDARHVPIFGKVVDLAESLLSAVSGAVTQAILSATGLSGPINQLMGNVTSKLMAFLGAGPILNGNDSAGSLMNWVVQGGAYSAEATARSGGASATNLASEAVSQNNIALAQKDDQSQESVFNRYLSTANYNSPTSKLLLSFSNVNTASLSDFVSGIPAMFKSFASAFLSPITSHAGAAAPDGYAASNFAGIQTYDYPAQCYNRDPLTETPQNGTNIQQVLKDKNIPDSDLTWDLVSDSDAWYQYVYKEIGENTQGGDDIANQIYNCNLLDNNVRGSLGNLYGYNDDHGLDDVSASVSTSTSPSTQAPNTVQLDNLYDSSVSVACADNTKDIGLQDGYYNDQPVKIRLCALPNLPSTGAESNGQYGVIGGGGYAVVNSRVSGVFYSLVEAAKAAGLTMQASSSFRSMTHQQCLYAKTCGSNTAAQPGYSNHQMGLAIDFVTTSGADIHNGDPWFSWLSANAPTYGIHNSPSIGEDWHWSPSGN